MSQTPEVARIGPRIAAGRATIDEISQFLFDLLPVAVLAVNEHFS